MKVGVLGAGAFGIALANILVTNDVYVDVWTHSEEEEKRLSKERTSDKLKGFKIPKEMKFTCDLEKTVKDKDLIVMAIPAFAFEEVTIKLKEYITADRPVPQDCAANQPVFRNGPHLPDADGKAPRQ